MGTKLKANNAFMIHTTYPMIKIIMALKFIKISCTTYPYCTTQAIQILNSNHNYGASQLQLPHKSPFKSKINLFLFP